MVLRTSGQLNISTPQGAPQVRQSGVGSVNPDVRKFSQGQAGGTAPETQGTSDRIIDSLIPLGQKVAQTAFKEQLESKYLEGVQAAAQGQSEEELSTNPLTADWTKAGYRDTIGRVAISQHQAQLQLDLPRLAQGTPEQFKQYMDEKRKPLQDQLEGMSKQQRAAMFGQMANDEVSAQKKYTTTRAAWILDQEEKSIQQSMTVRRGNLDAAKSDMQLYQHEVNGFVGAIYKDVWQNPKLTPKMQMDMTRQAAEYASSSDNVAVYDALKNTEVAFADGTKGTMMSRLSFEDQVKVDTAHRSAVDRVKVTRSQDFETWAAATKVALDDPNSTQVFTFDEIDKQLKVADSSGILGSGKREAMMTSLFKNLARNGDNAVLAKAYATGDQGAMFSRGKSQEDGLNAWLKVNKDAPLPQVVQGLMVIGNNSGMDSALTKAGEYLKAPFATLGNQDEVLPENAKIVSDTLSALTIAEKTNPGARAKFLQSMSSEQQDLALFMTEAQKEGNTDPLTITKIARAKVLQNQSSGGLISELRAKAIKEDAPVVQEIDDYQLLGMLSVKAKNWIGMGPSDKQRLSTGRGWYESADRTAEIRAQGQVALSEELDTIRRNSPFLSADSRRTKALAAVAARAVDTESGPLIMPRGQTVQSYFGVPEYADRAMVGQAIDTMMKPADGNRISWSISPDNKLLFKELNGSNQVVPNSNGMSSGILDPKAVAPFVQQQLDKEAAKASNEQGPGVTVQGVQYNGLNTANVEPKHMLALRGDIVKSEGVSKTPYADSGGTSFGVGIHQTNNHYQRPPPGGTYSDGQISDTFMRASNDAAELAQKSMRSIKVEGEAYLRFFGELAYQSPKSARDPDLLAYISLGDKAGALKALKETKAYKGSKAERQAVYVSKLETAMR